MNNSTKENEENLDHKKQLQTDYLYPKQLSKNLKHSIIEDTNAKLYEDNLRLDREKKIKIYNYSSFVISRLMCAVIVLLGTVILLFIFFNIFYDFSFFHIGKTLFEFLLVSTFLGSSLLCFLLYMENISLHDFRNVKK